MGFNQNRFLSPLFLLFGRRLESTPPFPVAGQIIKFNGIEWELATGGILSAVQSSSNVGTGDGLALLRVGDDLPFKTLVDGVEIVITVSATELTFSIGAIAISKITGLQVELDSKIETLTNVGGEKEIAKAKVGQNVDIRTLKAGTGIILTQNVDDIEIENAGISVTTASNVGTGVDVFKQKVLNNLEFRTLLANAEILITQNALDLAFSIGAIAQSKITGLVTALASKIETLTNVGVGVGKIAKAKVGTDVPIKSILAGSNIIVTNLTDEIEIEAGTVLRLSQMANCYDTEEPANLDFLAIVGITAKATIEIERQIIMPQPLTFQRLSCQIDLNPSIVSTNLTMRINGVDGNLSIVIGAGLTGSFQDLVNTDVVANADLCNYQVTFGATGTAISFVSASVQVVI